MALNSDERKKFLEILATTPFLIHASKKVGVSRATIYRWMKSDPDFKQKVDEALMSGRENLVEVAEAVIVKKIHDGDVSASKFFLTHNSDRYRNKPHRSEPRVEPEKTDPMAEIKDVFYRPDGTLNMSEKTIAFIKKDTEKEKRSKNEGGGTSE